MLAKKPVIFQGIAMDPQLLAMLLRHLSTLPYIYHGSPLVRGRLPSSSLELGCCFTALAL